MLTFTLVQAQDLGMIARGTYSWRVDADGTILNGTPGNYQLIKGTYYGAPTGARTNGWDSSPFLDYSYHFSTNGNTTNTSIYNHRMNFRLKFPEGYDSTDTDTKYPVIVFMHGAGERGDCWNSNCYSNNDPKNFYNNDHSLYHGGRKHLSAVTTAGTDSLADGAFDGFLYYPQNKNGWGAPTGNELKYATNILEILIEGLNIDKKRIYIHGLSNGGKASWNMITNRPDLFAAAAPQSGIINPVDPAKTVHIPVWQFQGGNDRNPYPFETENQLKVMEDYGATPRYQLLPNVGHGTWNIAYSWGEVSTNNSVVRPGNEFFDWFEQYSKLTIHPYFGITEVCEDETPSLRMGISPGFDAYEWKKIDGLGGETPYPSAPGADHEIIADEVASYAVRYMDDGEWTEWSDPVQLTTIPRSEAAIYAEGSTFLPGLDGSNAVTLKTETFGNNYKWFRDGILVDEGETMTEIQVEDPGVYTMVVNVNGLCDSNPSNPIVVKVAPFSGTLPDVPAGFQAIAASENEIGLFWTDNDDELGYELYRTTTSGSNYTFIKNFPSNAIYYKDSALDASTQYYYVLRAFNLNGASAPTPEAGALTLTDSEPPTAPQNLVFTGFNYDVDRLNVDPDNKADEFYYTNVDEVKLAWEPATDKVGIMQYSVYFGDGTFIGNTTDTSYTVLGLTQETTYQFYVVAEDIANNVSSPSNQITVSTVLDGVYFNLYAGGTWQVIKDFSTDNPWVEQIPATQFNINDKNPHYSDNDYFAFDWYGILYIDNPGDYRFRTTSDDGSQFWIDGVKVVDNDGRHGTRTRTSGYVNLTAGPHFITVKFFEATGGANLTVRWEEPGQGFVTIPSDHLRSYGTFTPPSAPSAPTGLTATAHSTEYQVDLAWEPTVVVLGSSTAEGTGATAGNSWVELFDDYLTSTGNSVTNLAKGGFKTTDIRATGTDNGSFDDPDPARNITAALALNPDMIIVNLPSNNVAADIPVATTISHYTEIKALADAAGVDIFFTTSQPRNFGSNSAKRHLLEDEAIAVRANFTNVIDIYDELTNFAGDNRIKNPQYDSGDGIHVNDAGHAYIYSEVVATVGASLGSYTPVQYEIYRSTSGGGPYEIIHTTGVGENSYSDTGLDASTTYYYVAKAVSDNGTSGNSNEASALTIIDNTPPTEPGTPVVQSYTDVNVAISWAPSTDNVAVTGYAVHVYQGGSEVLTLQSGRTAPMRLLGNSPATSMLVTGLTPNTEYTFTVSALDLATNESSESPGVIVTTQASSPLPVDFLKFTADKTVDGIQLNWSTASETNNEFFTVERSSNLEEFASITTVEGAGNSNVRLDYTYLDRNPIPVAYYRIKQTDFDGQYDYSKVVMVRFQEDRFTIYPNPTNSQNINIRGDIAAEQAYVTLVNPLGMTLFEHNISKDDLRNGAQIRSNADLKPGIYIVFVNSGEKILKRKLIIN